ncbi:hypothetical protein [Iodobacter ciconiae]|nr:hypothetical protein [Iodobacter ciconiae]
MARPSRWVWLVYDTGAASFVMAGQTLVIGRVACFINASLV